MEKKTKKIVIYLLVAYLNSRSGTTSTMLIFLVSNQAVTKWNRFLKQEASNASSGGCSVQAIIFETFYTKIILNLQFYIRCVTYNHINLWYWFYSNTANRIRELYCSVDINGFYFNYIIIWKNNTFFKSVGMSFGKIQLLYQTDVASTSVL